MLLLFSIIDIKPENLLIGKNDVLKLCDFGKYTIALSLSVSVMLVGYQQKGHLWSTIY